MEGEAEMTNSGRTLSIWSMSNITNFLGMLGIMASLIFVGLEMRQSHRIAQAAQQQERASMLAERINVWLEAGLDWQSIHFEQDYDYTHSEAITAMRNSAHQSWTLYENDYEQFALGLLSADVWEAKMRGMQRVYNLCEVRPIFRSRLPMFSEGFRNILSGFDNSCEG